MLVNNEDIAGGNQIVNRNALRVELHSSNVVLYTGDSWGGIWSEVGSDVWRVSGESIIKLLTAAGIQTEPVRNGKKWEYPTESPEEFSVVLERVPVMTSNFYGEQLSAQNGMSIHRINILSLAPNLLDMMVYWDADTAEHVTYSGTYTNQWEE